MEKHFKKYNGKVNKQTSENYLWGQNCLAYVLSQTEALTIKEELMPPDTAEELHFHKQISQFFYVLEGQADFILDGKPVKLEAGDGLFIPPKTPHQIRNLSSDVLRFLVISSPGNDGDRYPETEK